MTRATVACLIMASLSLPAAALAEPLVARPANFYAMEFSAPGAPCEAVLKSLNAAYQLTAAERNIVSNPTITTDLFLHSDLQIDWRQRRISFGGDVAVQTLDIAASSFAGSANQIVIRWSFFSSDHLLNELFAVPEAMAQQLDATTLPPSIVKTIAGPNGENEIKLDPQTVPDLWAHGRGPKSFFFDSDVLVVDGRALVLAMDAFEAADAQFQSGPLHVYALRPQSRSKLDVICRFEHRAPA